MIRLLFDGFNASGFITYYEIDRTNRKFRIATLKTRGQLVELPYEQGVFDKGDNIEEIEKLSDEKFVERIVMHMKGVGYTLRECDLNAN